MLPNALRATLSNIKASRQVSLASIGSITVALAIFGVFLFVYVNLNVFLTSWNREIRLIIYLNDKITVQQKASLETRIQNQQEVARWTYVSQDQAWKKFKATFSEGAAFLDDLDFNPLPASYNLEFKPGAGRLREIRVLADTFKSIEGVESIDFGEKWIARFEAFMIFLRLFLMALGVLLGLGALTIISNTVKLSIISRKDEIELMLLIGATPGYIKSPYMLEGVFHGFLGAAGAIGLVKGLQIFLQSQFGHSLGNATRGIEFQFISAPYLATILFFSISLGWLASYLSVNQFLKSYSGR